MWLFHFISFLFSHSIKIVICIFWQSANALSHRDSSWWLPVIRLIKSEVNFHRVNIVSVCSKHRYTSEYHMGRKLFCVSTECLVMRNVLMFVLIEPKVRTDCFEIHTVHDICSHRFYSFILFNSLAVVCLKCIWRIWTVDSTTPWLINGKPFKNALCFVWNNINCTHAV